MVRITLSCIAALVCVLVRLLLFNISVRWREWRTRPRYQWLNRWPVLPWRRACRAALLAIIVVTPKTASAQGDTYARMSVSTTQMYDGNLFATPASRVPQADLISRFGPALEAGYVSIPIELVARYAIDAERYLSHAELNMNVARQDAGIELRYLPRHRLGLSLDASYVATQTPGELNLESLLAAGRAHAARLAMGSAATYEWSAATKVTLDYAFARDELAGGVASATHSSRVGFERRTGLRNTYRVDSQFRHVGFGDGAPEASYAITGGWVHGITPRTGFEIAVGPRLTEGATRPEVSALLRRQLRLGDLSVGYSRTQVTAIGEHGTIDVHRVAASATYRPERHLTLSVTPAFARSARDERHVPVYTLDVEAVVEATRRLSLVASGRIGRQEGTLAGPREAIPYRSLALKLMVTLPQRGALPQ